MAAKFNTFFCEPTKPTSTSTSTSTRRSAYWKLPAYASLPRPEGTAPTLKTKLRALGLPFAPLATAKRCEKLLQRKERGLLAYEALSAAALISFARERRLFLCEKVVGQHDKMVKLLERADDEAKFEKFLDLPCELRVMVYEFHVAGLELPRSARRVKSPPICRASALLRREALPLFEAKEMER